MGQAYDDVLARVRDVRHGDAAVLLEGVHAVKHALRFGADVELVVTPDRDALDALLARLAPDVSLPATTRQVPAARFRELTGGRELPSAVLGVARRPRHTVDDVLGAPGRVVVLEQPRHLGNLGAVVRVAAAAGAGGVLVVGEADPWHPTAVRAAAGLQLAVAVARAAELPPTSRRLVALDPSGGAPPGVLGADDVLLVGTERGGLSAALRSRAEARVAIPMRAGVSSLNLATAVAVALYA